MNGYLKALAEEPLNDAKRINKVWLPEGKRSAPRSTKPVYEGDFLPPPLKTKELRERQQDAHSAKIVAILDYYATTDTPFERIAEHTRLTIEQVETGMKRRGRTC